MYVIGLISDTHGVLRPEALRALTDVDHIIHAGDVGADHILEALKQIAPVTAVRGNVDYGPWAQALPEHATVSFGPTRIHVIHRLQDMDRNALEGNINAAIYGHTHQSKIETIDGTLYINPGAAGPRRFKLPVSVGRIYLTSDGSLNASIETLNCA